MVFDQHLFQHHLSTQTWGRPLHYYEILDSTNTQLWALLKQGAQPGTAVIASQQKAGRGQWGRTWESNDGGLYLSVAIAPHIPVNQTAQLTVATIWGLATLLRQHHIPVWLKWPNDLLVYGKKLGGILTETNLQNGQVHTAVIGIGLNWHNPVPPQAINLHTILGESSGLNSLEQLAALTLSGLEAGYLYWQIQGIDQLLPDYLNLVKIYPPTHQSVREDVAKRLGLSMQKD
ncbi:biotin--[acetyl-CoA-carboxylase] ligase [Acaryochloris sp. IP29b_bin.148]|uniref:biotin--[acetyl-CoA-carboxylase] ligase n=1 Tax=Acaryochloris sp. IP29b_bin.148 TaxID=2969218 RepID=UPI002612CF7B|nr:biotin--[acetyl-CoA-carboxylase] ligase [Acaryochloris sp. IP29b_bin.148]